MKNIIVKNRVMIKKAIRNFVLFMGIVTSSYAQTIQVDFAHFKGKEYVYILNSGDKRDTIIRGKFDNAGKATLVLPINRKAYIGMSQLIVAESGEINFIVNKEDFSAYSTEEPPTFENIKYTGSAENDFITNKVKQQKSILEKFSFAQYGLTIFKKEDPLYTLLEKEKENENLQFAALKSLVAKSPLYAVKFVDIYDFLIGLGSSLEISEEAKTIEMNNFVKTKLDIDALYTSSLWSPVIESWVQLQQNMIKNDAVFLTDTKQILSRINNKTIYTAFAEKIVALLTKTGKDDMVNDRGAYVAKSGKIENPGNNLVSAMKKPVKGKVATALITENGKRVIKNKTVLFFYESGCNNCENEIHQLLGNYQIIKDKGYDVISVAADMTVNAGDGHGHEFPWKDQLCDYKGFAGVNFKNYNVIGTPTFFVIDDKGTITGTYARLADTKILN